MDRRAYAETFGPTVGDRIRLADTELIIEVERDYTTYGDEVKFGGGKVIRDGMGQSPIANADGAVDMVITNALILDWWGIWSLVAGPLSSGGARELPVGIRPKNGKSCAPFYRSDQHGR